MSIIKTLAEKITGTGFREAYKTRNDSNISRMPLWLTIVTILLGLLFLSLQGLIFRHGSMDMDSWSYTIAWHSMLDGQIDTTRPPVYATIIGLTWEWLTMGYGNILLPIVQWTLYIASLQLLWIINSWLKVSRVCNIAAILSMLLIPGFWIFNNIMMAESVSLSGIILLTWLSGRYIITRKSRYLWFSGLMMLLLIFTKPMFIFLMPILAVLWGVTAWKNPRQTGISLLILGVTGGLVWAYAAGMQRTYGVTSLTIASTNNRYCCLRADGAIIPDEISDPVTREKFLPLYEADPGVQNPDNRYMIETALFTWPEIDRLVKEAAARHPYAEIEGIAYRVKTSMKYSQFFFYLFGYDEQVDEHLADWNGLSVNSYHEFIFPFHRYLWFPIWVTAIIWLTFSSIWIRRWWKSRNFPAMPFFISATIFTGYVSAILGAPDVWGRIMTPVTPLIPVMAASVVTVGWGYVKKSLTERRFKRRGFA